MTITLDQQVADIAPTSDAVTTDIAATVGARYAGIAWNHMATPGDPLAGALCAAIGHEAALEHVINGSSAAEILEDAAGTLQMNETVLARALAQWQHSPAGVAATIQRCNEDGMSVIIRDDWHWPRGVNRLGIAAPHAIYIKGDVENLHMLEHGITVVGARAASNYGEIIAGEIAKAAINAGSVVVSGGAYGIDTATHRGALSVAGATVAILAGGVDRAYPNGNAEMFDRIIATGGLLMSEQAPGAQPSRARFQRRCDLLAAVTAATIVVEAGSRSGALKVAFAAEGMRRIIAAVPGPITSPSSVGCHRLIRDHDAEIIFNPSEDIPAMLE